MSNDPIAALTDEITALEAAIKAARKAGDIAALLPLAAETIRQLESLAATASPSDQKNLLSAARRIAYNAAADAFPGWESPPPARTKGELLAARDLSIKCAELDVRIAASAKHQANAAWLVGAMDLALGARAAAVTAFRKAESLFAETLEMAMLNAGYRAIAGDADAPAFVTTCTTLANSGLPHAAALRDQLVVAHKVFGGG
jgi:hypothetical protein